MTELDWKIDTGSDGNLILVNMFKMWFPRTTTEFNKYKNKTLDCMHIMIQAYHSLVYAE